MSHLQGTDYVGSMVVFEDGLRQEESDYRRFKVSHGAGNDDYAAMEEVLTRRLTRSGGGGRRRADRRGVGRADSPTRPSCCCWTAGNGQLGVGVKVLESLGLVDRDALAALAKSFEEVYRPGSAPTRFGCRASRRASTCCSALRDEAHRFAISFHRTLRGKRMAVAPWTGSPGSGRAPLPPGRGVRRADRRAGRARWEELLSPIVVTGRGRSGRLRRLHAPLLVNGNAMNAKGGRMSEYLVVTGMSGAGRSTAAATLEDLGWFVIDNMPSALISKISELVDGAGSEMERVAFVVGRGGGDLEYFDDLPDVLTSCGRPQPGARSCSSTRADDVLVRRYEGTRRRHPLAARGVEDSIADERLLLERAARAGRSGDRHRRAQHRTSCVPGSWRCSGRRPGRRHADLGDLLRVQARHAARRRPRVRLPLPAQPYWIESLRRLQRARRAEVANYVLGRPRRQDFLDKVDDLLCSSFPPTSGRGSPT